MRDKLNQNNFMMFAMKMYSNPLCTGIEEFKEDMNRIKYIKRLFLKYKKNHKLKDRLILNHIIILQNVFGAEACSRILFYKLNSELHSVLKTFLDYLQYLPPSIPEVNLSDIELDQKIVKILSRIK
jgi:hypothetical protein